MNALQEHEMFYSFEQNDTFGYFLRDEMLAEAVIIEAENADAANEFSQRLGMIFDDEEEPRWHKARVGHEEPMLYGSTLSKINREHFTTKRGKVFCRIYRLNGNIEELFFDEEEKVQMKMDIKWTPRQITLQSPEEFELILRHRGLV